MRVLVVLTYYRPHVSGLTIYAQRLADGLAERGHQVTVLTSRHSPDLPSEDVINGVRVVRVPVVGTVSKGVLMPTFGLKAAQLARKHDVMSVHLPQLEAGLASFLGRAIDRTPVVLTYHCDLQLPSSALNRAIDEIVYGMNYAAATCANRIVAYTEDYATHSRLLSRFPHKIEVIPPPVVVAPLLEAARLEMRKLIGIQSDDIVVGICTRLASEKGVEYALQAIPEIESASGRKVRVVHAGEHQNVPGEEEYLARLQPIVDRYRDQITFLGVLSQSELPAFYSNLDVLVVSSVNSTESFGLVQVEAMMFGTPCVSTNLPGVREPVRMTGMGEVVPLRDPVAIAQAVVNIVNNRECYVRARESIEEIFDLNRTLDQYEELFTGLQN